MGEHQRINLAQGRDRFRAVVCIIMNFRFPENAGNVLDSRGTVSF